MSSSAPALTATAPSHHAAFGPTDVGLILMSVIWGVNYSVVKTGLMGMSPLTFTGLRVTFAAAVLWLIGLSLREAMPPRKDVWALLALGVIGNGFYQCLFIFGMSHTRAGIASLIVAASPAWIAIVSRIFGREQLSGRGWRGIACQLAGVACVVGSASAVESSGQALLGAGLIAMGSIMWAIFSVLLQPYTQRAHPIHLSAITLSSGAVFILLFALPGMARLDWSAVSARTWGAVFYASIGAMVIAYLLFYRGIKVLGPTRTAMYGNLQPIIALAVAALMLGEHPTGWQLLGAALIMAGLVVSRTAPVHAARAASPIQDRL